MPEPILVNGIDQIRIVVVDDHSMLRTGIAHKLNCERDMVVVGEGGSAEDAVRLAAALGPDVMLLDLNMPGGGLEALRRIAGAWPALSVIVISVRDDEVTVAEAIASGASGYLAKGVTGCELVSAIREVYKARIQRMSTLETARPAPSGATASG